MPISRAEFVQAYPTLFHISLARNLEQVMQHGLLSTSALLDLCELEGEPRFQIEGRQRPRPVRISHLAHGEFLVNDQAPMNPAALLKCLTDLSPEQWCRSLNRRVFFWPTESRLAKHVDARIAAGRSRIVFALETRSMLDALDFDLFEFSGINSGSTMRKAALRGSKTFQNASDYPFEERRRRNGVRGAIAEVTYPYALTTQKLTAISMRVELISG